MILDQLSDLEQILQTAKDIKRDLGLLERPTTLEELKRALAKYGPVIGVSLTDDILEAGIAATKKALQSKLKNLHFSTKAHQPSLFKDDNEP